MVRHFLPLLLKKETIVQSAVVDVTRNADVFFSSMEDRADDNFRDKISGMLSKRKREMPVRVRIFGKLTDPARSLLIRKLRVPEDRVFTQAVPFDLSFRSCIGGPASFRYPDRKPSRDIGLKKGEYFSYIEKHDLLLSFPFQSMMSFVDLIYEAADDPDVRSIKITLYRMSGSSKIAAALAYAADRARTCCACWSCGPALTNRTILTIPKCWRTRAAASFTACRTRRCTASCASSPGRKE